jgi:hypothetical protein
MDRDRVIGGGIHMVGVARQVDGKLIAMRNFRSLVRLKR